MSSFVDALSAFADLMGANAYAAHSICLSNDPVLMALYIGANETIAFAYYIIGGVLLWTYIHDGRKITLELVGGSALLFGAFILACGLTHLVMDILLFTGVYRLDVLMRMITAGISAATAGRVVVDRWIVRGGAS